MQQKRLTNLDIFRAVAALAVCLFHFGNNNLLGIPVLSSFLQHGHLGVIVFFVISGYIIPYALFRSGTGLHILKGFSYRDLFAYTPHIFLQEFPRFYYGIFPRLFLDFEENNHLLRFPKFSAISFYYVILLIHLGLSRSFGRLQLRRNIIS